MSDVIFLMVAIVFLLVAFVTAFATMNASPRLMRLGNRVSLWQLCLRPSLNSAGGLVSRSAAGLRAGATKSFVFWSAPRPNLS